MAARRKEDLFCGLPCSLRQPSRRTSSVITMSYGQVTFCTPAVHQGLTHGLLLMLETDQWCSHSGDYKSTHPEADCENSVGCKMPIRVLE